MSERPVRANRGNRLKTLIDATFVDDELADAWKDSDDDTSSRALSGSSDSVDSDFSATESSGRLTDAEADALEDEPKLKRPRPEKVAPLRERKASLLSQCERMTTARVRAEANSVALREYEARVSRDAVPVLKVTAPRSNVDFSSTSQMLLRGFSHVVGTYTRFEHV